MKLQDDFVAFVERTDGSLDVRVVEALSIQSAYRKAEEGLAEGELLRGVEREGV